MCAAQEGNCASQGSRFPRFALEGKPPRGVSKGPDDLSLCRIYRKRTCCTADQTNAALASMSKLATSGEGNAECLSVWEVLECSIRDPRVGITPGPPLICASLCRSLFASCRDAFFANDPLTQVNWILHFLLNWSSETAKENQVCFYTIGAGLSWLFPFCAILCFAIPSGLL